MLLNEGVYCMRCNDGIVNCTTRLDSWNNVVDDDQDAASRF